MEGMKAIEIDLEELVKSFRATTAYGEYSDADERDLVWGEVADKAESKSLNEVLDELENDVNPRVGETEVGYEGDFEWEADEISLDDDDLDLTFSSPTSSPF